MKSVPRADSPTVSGKTSEKKETAMKKLLKAIAIFTVAVFATTAVAGVTLAAAVVKDGFVTVAVEEHSEDGARLTIPVPAALINLALSVAPMVIPPDEMAQIRREIDPYAPALHAAADALESCPQARIVDVRTDSETIQVIKQRNSFLVDVRSQEADVQVSIPADALGRVLRAFGV